MKHFLKIKTLLAVLGFLFQSSFMQGQILVENFDYALGTSLTTNGWTAHSGNGTNPISVGNGLTFDGYAGSGIGGAAMVYNNGEDVHRTFDPQTSGTIYAAFIVETQSTNSAGYFLHFGQTTISTTFFTRVWVNGTGSGLGIGTNAPSSYIPITPNVPTLVVIKLDYATKLSSLYVFNSFPSAEPATPDMTFTETASYSNVGSIALRQYNAAQRIIVDGIRIAANWEDAVASSGAPTTVATPTFNPLPGNVLNPFDLTILCATPASSIHYTLDGSEPDQNSTLFTVPVSISQTTTVKAIAYADGLEPSNIATGIYSFPAVVNNLGELRNSPLGSVYELSGEAWLTFQQEFRNQKYIQDATGAILIDDLSGNITTAYEIGDGITGITGTLGEFGGMLQFVPIADPGAATSSGNFPEPEVVTIGQLFSDFDAYESKLVKINSATFANGGANFTNAGVFAISDDSKATGNFRATFFDVDYIGTEIPLVPVDIVGLPNSRVDGEYITARNLADFTENVVDPEIILLSPNGGEIWEKGKTYSINWQNIGFSGNVNINILRGLSNISLAANIANTGTWSWTIPAGFVTANNYIIRVAGVNPGEPFDVSNANFTITDPLPDPVIVINEIHYNPAGSQGLDDHHEFVELYNNSGFAVNLSNWSFSQGIAFTFPVGTIMADDSYLVVARVPDTLAAFYGISNIVGPFGGALSNTGEAVALANAQGEEMDYVSYLPGGAWPTAPNGGGPSLELFSPDLDNTLPESWMASLAQYGTPGLPNSVGNLQIVTVIAPNGGEVFEQGSTQDISWSSFNFNGNIKIEIFDTETTTVLAENVPVADESWEWLIAEDFPVGNNYKIRISDMEDGEPMDESDAVFTIMEVIVPSVTILSPAGGETYAIGTTQVITWTSEFFDGFVKLELNDGLRGLTLIEDSIAVSAGQYIWNIPTDIAAGDTYSILVSGVDLGYPSDESPAFSIVEPVALPAIIINEIMYNSPGDDNEWIELYNRGSEVVDLEGYYLLDDDITHTPVVFTAGYSIAPGQYFTVSLQLLAPPLGFTPDFEGNATWALGNNSDAINLYNPFGQLVNGVAYTDSDPWPTTPDGFGPTLSLLATDLDNSLPQNWAASLQDYGTPGAENFPAEATLLLFTPNGGETIEQGSLFVITWNYNNYEGDIVIELLTSERTAVELATVPVADLSYNWTVAQEPGESYLIKISAPDGEPMDMSDATFTIVPAVVQPDVITLWDFDEENLIPSIGAGTAGNIGGTSTAYAAGNGGGRGWNTSAYPAQSANSGAAGVEFMTSTVGYDEIVISFDHRASGTASRWAEVHYTIDGVNWQVFANNEGGISPHDTFYGFTFDLSSIADVANNPDFGFRIVSVFSPLAFNQNASLSYGENEAYMRANTQATYPPAPGVGTGNYAPGGTWRFDNVSVSGFPLQTGEAVKLAIINVNNGVAPVAGEPFSVTVQAQDENGLAAVVEAAVPVSLQIENGSGVLSGTLAGTIIEGSAILVFDNVIYSQAETGVVIKAIADDMSLTEGLSMPFDVNAPAPPPRIVINEIMYNPPESGTDYLEFLELYNADDVTVNLENWYFSAGITYVFPSVELAPGEYLVVAVNAAAIFDAFGVEALQWTGGALSNGGELVELSNADGVVVNFVDYDDAAPWPVAPDEYGPSLALIDPSLDNSLAANWLPETTFAFDHPAGIPVYATPGAANFATPGQGILIANGWGGVSTYIAPNTPQIANIIDPIVDDVTVMQNFNEIYFPVYDINTIGNWNNNVGYKIKMEATRYLVVNGAPVANKTLTLPNGWSGMPVLSKCPVDLLSLLGGNPAIIFVKEMDSAKVYWPGGGIQTLTELVPGKAYFIKVDGVVNITFPDCE